MPHQFSTVFFDNMDAPMEFLIDRREQLWADSEVPQSRTREFEIDFGNKSRSKLFWYLHH